jgi:NifU-like protein involved in Fe-S cluster formation
MDEAVIKYYRRLLREDFPNSGVMENPSIFIEAVGEKLINCGNTGNYMQLYLQVEDRRITDIKYLCACEPVANVAVEVLCTFVKGKKLQEVAGISEEAFYQFIGSRDEKLHQKVLGLLELLNDGIANHERALTGAEEPVAKAGDERGGNLSWDTTLST